MNRQIEQLTGIYHEQQEGALCAQHALNNLLQQQIYSAVDLADVARQLDEHERHVLGIHSHESQNMDDTGFFSIQVLQKALGAFNIELIPYASQHPIAQQARTDPLLVQAYICNLREHWLTIRRFGRQYFDLNSISSAPKLISDTYLSLYLAQLQHSGYSIFIISGDLPHCPADDRLANNTIDPAFYRTLTERADARPPRPTGASSSSASSFDDQELQRAIKASEEMDTEGDTALQRALAQSLKDAPSDDDLLQLAMAASLDTKPSEPVTPAPPAAPAAAEAEKPSVEELRQRRLQFFENKDKGPNSTPE